MHRRSDRMSFGLGQSFMEEDTASLLQGPFGDRPTNILLGSALSEVNESRYLNDSCLTSVQGELTLRATIDGSTKFESGEPLESLHDHFHGTLELYKGKSSVFDVIKDFVGICYSFMQSKHLSLDIEKWLFDERNTWRLLHTLMEDRLGYTENDQSMEDSGFPVSEKEVMLDVFKNDAVTRQCQLVVDWLEASESDKRIHQQSLLAEHFTDKTMCWENTILQIKQKGNTPYSSSVQLVTEIDPDAPVRQNLPIHKLDAEDDELFLNQILSHIRCGQLEQAQKLCIHCGQPWRAATLEGWRLYHNPNIANSTEEPKKEGYLLPVEGNPNRDIWKLAAWRMSEDERMPAASRATFGAFCGNLQAMLLSMDSWHDWLWAHLRAMIDVRIEEEIRERCTDRTYVDMPRKYWANKMNLRQIFIVLASSPNALVRLEHSKELSSIQRYIILDDMDALYHTLASWARQISNNQSTLSTLLIRFCAHLVIVLRALGKEQNDTYTSLANEVLQVYSQFIIQLGNPTLIMSYIAKLPKGDQVVTLARYLEKITEPEQKAICLKLASREGLDAETAAQYVVESIRARDIKHGTDFLRGEATEEDVAKIEALDWLVVYPSQFADALWQANALGRFFISQGKLGAAKAAFAKLPPKTVSAILQEQLKELPEFEDLDSSMSPRHRSAIKEHLSLRLYLDAHHDFNEWFKFYHNERPAEPTPLPSDATFQQKLVSEEQVKQYQVKLGHWKKALSQLAKDTKARLFNILTFPDGGWLGCADDLEDESEVFIQRRHELEVLCKLCIPEVTLLIHQVSLLSGDPQGSMLLADVIGSERYKLYKVFSKEKLRELLGKLSESCIELLQQSKDPWGHTVTS